MDLFLPIFYRGMRQLRQAETRRRYFTASWLGFREIWLGAMTDSVRSRDANSQKRAMNPGQGPLCVAKSLAYQAIWADALGIRRAFVPLAVPAR
jgi:hypothetical protein